MVLLCFCQGNDQVRFELTCYALYPQVQVRSDPSPESYYKPVVCLWSSSRLRLRSSLRGGSQSSTTASGAGRTWWSTQRCSSNSLFSLLLLTFLHFLRSPCHRLGSDFPEYQKLQLIWMQTLVIKFFQRFPLSFYSSTTEVPSRGPGSIREQKIWLKMIANKTKKALKWVKTS